MDLLIELGKNVFLVEIDEYLTFKIFIFSLKIT